tara:strand:+ start:1735 stop:2217 length:483 start_codon:yes stop_codon:yes gene_type:complete
MEKLLNKKTVLKVKNYLNKFDKNLSIISLDETARSSKEAGNSLNVKTGAIVKSLIFKSIDSDYYLCLISGDKTVSINKLSKLTKKEILKPNANEIKEITGFSIGGVPPVAHKIKMRTYIDKNLNRFENIYAAAGHPHCVFKINFENLCKITNGYIYDIVN